MPSRALRPCNDRDCNALTNDKTGYCPDHIHLVEEIKQQRWSNQEASRKSARARGYDSRWEKARKIFLLSNPLCVECLREGKFISAKVVDHIVPHKGNQKLFWDKDNWQSLCTKHHDQKTARGK